MSTAVRLLDDPSASPTHNMAVDSTLLESVGSPVTLRTYTWDPAGLSLGRFQDEAEFAQVDGPHEVVRRITGGGAIYHGHELTFSLTYDLAEFRWDLNESYVAIHDAVRAALSTLGVASERLLDCPPTCRPTGWCFAKPTKHDLVAPDGNKLLGSAQRRTRRPSERVLHHGSIPIEAPAATPFVAAVRDQAPGASLAEVREAVVAAILGALGRAGQPGELTDAERSALEVSTS